MINFQSTDPLKWGYRIVYFPTKFYFSQKKRAELEQVVVTGSQPTANVVHQAHAEPDP